MEAQIRQITDSGSSYPTIALFRPNGSNIGDAMHYRGLKYILDIAFPPERRNTYEVYGEEKLSQSTLDFVKNKFDYIVVCGAPWLWDNIYPGAGDSPDITHRYHEFIKLLDLNPNACKLAFSIGASYPIGYTVDTAKSFAVCAKYHDNNTLYINKIWKQFSYIVTRDRLSKDIFAHHNIRAYQAPCTSVFTKYTYSNNRPKENYPLLVYYSVKHGHSKHHLTEQLMDEYYEMQYSFIQKYNPRVVCINKIDYEYYHAGGVKFGMTDLPPITCFKSDNDYDTHENENKLLDMLYNAKFILTGRVHAGIPAKSLGVPVICMPTDTRALCVIDVGGTLAYNKEQLSYNLANINTQYEINIANWKAVYIEHMRTAFKKVS